MQYIINAQGKIIFSGTKTGYFHDGQGLCRVQVNDKWGFINTSGQIVIPCIYEDCWPFEKDSYGTAKARFNGKYGLINKEGKTIVPFQYNSYDSVPNPHDGIICIKISETDDEKRNYLCIDSKGNHLFSMETLVPIEFSEGLASVWVGYDKGYGVIDRSGSFVIHPGIYDFISDFHLGVARVRKSNKEGYINNKGEIVVDINFDFISDNESNPIARVSSGKEYGYIDKRNGIQITPVMFGANSRDVCEEFSDKMGIIRTDTDIYVYNSEECRSYKLSGYNNISRFSKGLCAVELSGKIGFIDKHCNLAIPCIFEARYSYSYCCGFIGDSCAMDQFIIDRNGKILRTLPEDWQVESILPGHEEKEYLFHVANKRRGPAEATLFNLKGIPLCSGMGFYTTLPHCFPVAVRSKINGKWGFVDQNGKMIVPCQFEEPYTFEDGFATIDEPIQTTRSRGSSNSTFSGSNYSGGCYVATAVYGSYNCPEVWTLRRFRDNTLDETWYGRAFIKTYYAISPTLVKWFGKTPWFKRLWRRPLDKLVASLRSKGVEDSPYQDKY